MSSKYALIIGNSEYKDANLAKLAMPGSDVNDLAWILKDSDIGSFDEVTTLINELAATVRRAIAGFFAKKMREDLLLFYFSGHGVLDDQGHLFLAVKDTEHDLLSGTAIPARFITQEMDRSRSQRQVLIFDCCHSGAFARGAKGAMGASVGTAAAFEGNGFGRVVLTATDSTQYAWEEDEVLGEAENSVFTHYLIEGLKTGKADMDHDGWISLDELYDYVYEKVVQETPRQTPGKWSFKQQGEIVIARNPNPVVEPAELPAELLQAIESPLSAVREGIVRELDRLLYGSNKGMSLAAYEALKRLADDDSRRVSNLASESLAAFEEKQETIETADQIVEQASLEAEAKRREAEERKAAEERVRLIEKLLADADFFFKEEKIEQAIEAYNEVLELHPENQRALSGISSAENKKFQLAKLTSLISKGKSHLEDEKYSEALAIFQAALELDPKNQEAQGLITECEGQERKLEQINKSLDDGKRLFEKGKYKDAVEIFNQVITVVPNQPEAIDFITKAQEQIEESEKVNKLLLGAESCLENKEFDQAIENYKEVLTLDPQNQKAVAGLRKTERGLAKLTEIASLVSVGKSHFEKNEYSEALSNFKAALAFEPENQEVLAPIAECERKQKEIQQIDKLLSAGKKYFEKGSYKNALTTFNQVIVIDPNHSEASDFIVKTQKKIQGSEKVSKLLTDAESCFKNKAYEQSIQSYKELLEVDVQNKKAISGLKKAERANAVLVHETGEIAIPALARPVLESVKEFLVRRKVFIIFALLILIALPFLEQPIKKIKESLVESDKEIALPSYLEAAKEKLAQATQHAQNNQADVYASSIFVVAMSLAKEGFKAEKESKFIAADSLFDVASKHFKKAAERAAAALAGAEKEAMQAKERAIQAKESASQKGGRGLRSFSEGEKLLTQGDVYLEDANYPDAKSKFNSAEPHFRTALEEAGDIARENKALEVLKQEAALARNDAESARSRAEQYSAPEFAPEAYSYAIRLQEKGSQDLSGGKYADATSSFGRAADIFTRAVDESQALEQAKKSYDNGDYESSKRDLDEILSDAPYGENKKARELYNEMYLALNRVALRIKDAQSFLKDGDLRAALGILRKLEASDQKAAGVQKLMKEIIASDNVRPVISHTRPKPYKLKNPIKITVTVQDNLYVDEVWLHYIPKDFPEKKVKMNLAANGLYAFSIPADYAKGKEIRYYFTAIDISGNKGSLKRYKIKSSDRGPTVPQIP